MTAKRLKVIVTRRLPDPVELRLKELFDTELNETDTPFDDAKLVDAVKRADVLVPTVTDAIDARLLAQGFGQEQAPGLELHLFHLPVEIPLSPEFHG